MEKTRSRWASEHAKRLFKFLKGGDVEIQAAFPAGMIGSTAENLKASAAGEHHEWETMYHSLAESHGALLVPNIYEGIFGNRALLFMDGLHPNEDGYAAMAENYYKSMKPLLEYMKIDKREV